MNLQILLASNHMHANYTAGEIVNGAVSLTNNTSLEATGLVITMFMSCKIVISRDGKGHAVWGKATEALMTQDLTPKMMEGTKTKSKVFSPGTHPLIPFIFSPLPTELPCSSEDEATFCNYFLTVQLTLKTKEIVQSQMIIYVSPRPLNDNPSALGWQTKTESKYLKMTLKKVAVKVTMPTGIDREEVVPIHLTISNESKHPKIIIRSRLMLQRTYNKGSFTPEKDLNHTSMTTNASVQEVNACNCEVSTTHFLKVSTGFSFKSPLITKSHKIQVEVEFEKNNVLKMEFPVIVGTWIGEPSRYPSPFGRKYDLELHEPQTEEELIHFLLDTVATANSVTPTAPPVSPGVHAHSSSAPLPTSGNSSKLPLTESKNLNLPSAPPMDGYGSVRSSSKKVHQASTSPPSLQSCSVKAVLPYTADTSSELTFKIGQIITNVYQSNHEGWLMGTINEKTGMIPMTFVELL